MAESALSAPGITVVPSSPVCSTVVTTTVTSASAGDSV
jgi:hypothetical protein